MFTIAFRDGRDGALVYGARPLYNDEYLQEPYKGILLHTRIGESFSDFISLSGNFKESHHPYMLIAENAEEMNDHSFCFVELRKYVELSIENPAFFNLDCFMFFLDMLGMSIPANYHSLQRRPGHEDDCIEDAVPDAEGMDHYERSLRGFLAVGKDVYDVPVTVYECGTVEDACIASLHFMITHGFTIRKCANCGKFFVAYNRSDTLYCDRQSPFNKRRTCKEDGTVRKHIASAASDDLCKKIDNTQSMWRQRVIRNKSDAEICSAHVKFKKDLKKWKANYEAGRVTREAFMAWLDHFNSKRFRRNT